MRRIARAKRRLILFVGTILLAAPIGGLIGFLTQPSIDEATEQKLQASPDDHVQKRLDRLAKTSDSPETVRSGSLCYYAALQHATGHRFRLSFLFLEALERRFPDSPFVHKAENLKPLIETARKTDESPDAAAAAQARLTLEALPLAVAGTSQISSRPWWWRLLPAGDIVVAAAESKYADWPIRYAGETGPGSPWNPDRILMETDRTLFAVRGFGTSPFRALTASPIVVLPIVREHLDDPRLTGLVLNGSRHGPYKPKPVWRVCYDILCDAAGFRFDEIEPPPAHNRPFERRFELTLTPKIREYIDRWLDECLEMSQKESIFWHLRQADLQSQTVHERLVRLGRTGSPEEVLKLLHERLDPNDPDPERDEQIEIIRKELRERYPAPIEFTPAESAPTEERAQ